MLRDHGNRINEKYHDIFHGSDAIATVPRTDVLITTQKWRSLTFTDARRRKSRVHSLMTDRGGDYNPRPVSSTLPSTLLTGSSGAERQFLYGAWVARRTSSTPGFAVPLLRIGACCRFGCPS